MDEKERENLIAMPKKIVESSSKDFRQENQHLRRDFKLQSIDGSHQFSVFVRRHIDFQENFSIGLDFQPIGDREMPLIRCNGPHDVVENLLKPIPHFDYHIHMPKTEDIERGIRKLSFSEITDQYDSFEKALHYFIKRTNILNITDYFDLQIQLL